MTSINVPHVVSPPAIQRRLARALHAPEATGKLTVEEGGSHRVAFALYLLFMVSWFVHLPERNTILGEIRFDVLLLGVIAGFVLTAGPAEPTNRRTAITRLIPILVVYVIVTLPFVEWPGSVLRENLVRFGKAVLFYYFTVRLVTSERRVMQLLMVFTLCQIFRVLEPLYLHLTQGYWGGGASMAGDGTLYRLAGAPLDDIGSNGLAFVVLTAIPFAHYLWTRTVRGTLLYLALFPLLVYALVLTASRSGLLGLVITFVLIWMQSRRKVLLGAVAVLAVVLAIPLLTDDLRDRYASIVSANTRNAGTAQGRIEGVKRDLQVAMRRPVFGHGLGTSSEANANFAGYQQASHNLPAEVLQEIGLVGFLIFAALLASIERNVRTVLRTLRTSDHASSCMLAIGKAVHVWYGMNLLFSLFTYGLSSYSWYLLGGLAEVLGRLSSGTGQTSPEAVAVPMPHAPSLVRLAAASRARKARRPLSA
jgi:hypothetical protein